MRTRSLILFLSFALVLATDQTVCAKRVRVNIMHPKTGKTITMSVRRPVYLVHGILSSNRTWGSARSKCMLYQLQKAGYGLNENLFMVGAHKLGSPQEVDAMLKQIALAALSGTVPLLPGLGVQLPGYFSPAGVLSGLAFMSAKDKANLLYRTLGLPNKGLNSNWQNLSTISKDTKQIMDSVPPEFIRDGIDMTYRELQKKYPVMGIEVIAHSNGGRTATLYAQQTVKNRYRPFRDVSEYDRYSRTFVAQQLTGIPAYDDSFRAIIGLGVPLEGSPVADEATTKQRLSIKVVDALTDIPDQTQISELRQDSPFNRDYSSWEIPANIELVNIIEDRENLNKLVVKGSVPGDGATPATVKGTVFASGQGAQYKVVFASSFSSSSIPHTKMTSNSKMKEEIKNLLEADSMADALARITDRPDDNEDLSIDSLLPLPQEDFSPRLIELAKAKNKSMLLAYIDYEKAVEKQMELLEKGLGKQAEPYGTIIQELFPKLLDQDDQIWREYQEAADVAILEAGAFRDAAELILSLDEPATVVPQNFDPLIYENKNVMIIPSGAIGGYGNSKFFRARLDEFVKQGGVLLCFSQPYGYQYSSLPPMKDNGLSGYGWQQDQNCYYKGSYLDQLHPSLKGQKDGQIDVYTDGFFTEWPEGAFTPIRRAKNDAPTVVIYPYGKGWVAATTFYMDWGFTHQQFSEDEAQLIKDLLAWAKKPGVKLTQDEKKNLNFEPRQSEEVQFFVTSDAEEYARGAKALFTFHVTNKSEQDRQFRIYYAFPRSRFSSLIRRKNLPAQATKFLDLEVPAQEKGEASIAVPVKFSPETMIGLLYDTDDNHRATTSRTFWIVRTSMGVKVVTPEDLSDLVESIPVQVECSNPSNSVLDDVRIRLSLVDPESNKVFDELKITELDEQAVKKIAFKIPRTGKNGYYSLLAEVWNGDEKVGLGTGHMRIQSPIITVSPNLIQMDGKTLRAEFLLHNLGSFPPTKGKFKAKLVSPTGKTLHEVPQLVDIDTKMEFKVSFVADDVGPLKMGDYKLIHELSWGDEKVEGIKVLPNQILIDGQFDKSVYDTQDAWNLDISLSNIGLFTQNVKLNVEIPGIGYKNQLSVAIKASDKANIILQGVIPDNADVGGCEATLILEMAGAKASIATFRVREPNLAWELASSDYEVGNTLNITLHNDGGASAEVQGAVSLEDLSGNILTQRTVETEIVSGAAQTLPLQIPVSLRTGPYAVIAEVLEAKTKRKTVLKKPISVKGVQASIDSKLSKVSLDSGDSLDIEALLKNMGVGSFFQGNLRAKVMRKGLSPPEQWDIFGEGLIGAFARDGNDVWMSIYSGTPHLIRFNKLDQTWKTLVRSPETYQTFKVHSIIPRANNVWFLGESDGVSRYDKKRVQWINYNNPEHLSTGSIRSVAFDGDDVWFVGTRTVDKLNMKTNEWMHFKGGIDFPDVEINAIDAKDGEVWLATQSGAYRYDSFGQRWKLTLPNEDILAVAIGADNVWVGINQYALPGGRFRALVGRFDRVMGSWSYYYNTYKEKGKTILGNSTLPATQIDRIVVEDETVWFGGATPNSRVHPGDTGVSQYNKLKDLWHTFDVPKRRNDRRMVTWKVTERYIAFSEAYTGGYGVSLTVFDRIANKWQKYPDGLMGIDLGYYESFDLLEKDGSAEFWTVLRRNGTVIAKLNEEKSIWETAFFVGPIGVPNQIFQDDDGDLWILTTNASGYFKTPFDRPLTHYNTKKDEWENILASPEGMLDDRFQSVLVDENDIWVGHVDGISRLNKKKNQWSRYHGIIERGGDALNPTLPFDINIVRGILSDSNFVWFFSGESTNELYRYEKAKEKWSKFDIPVKKMTTFGVAEEAVWVGNSSDKFVARLDKQTEKYTFHEFNINSVPSKPYGGFVLRVTPEDVWFLFGPARFQDALEIERLKNDGNLLYYKGKEIDPGFNGSWTYRSLVQRGEDFLFLGNQGILRLNDRTGKWSVIRAKKGKLLSDRLLGIGLRSKDIWLGTSKGISIWEPETDVWQTFPADEAEVGVTADQFIFSPDPSLIWARAVAGSGGPYGLVRMRTSRDNSKPLWINNFEVKVGEVLSIKATITDIFGPGEYELILELYNAEGQLVAKDVKPFTIKQGPQLVAVTTDKEYYLPGAMAQVDVRVTNPSKAPVQGVPVGLFYGEEELFFERWDLEAGESRAYSVLVTAAKDKRLRAVAGDTVVDRVLDVRQPALESTLKTPDIAGQEAFPVEILLNNTGEADLQLKVKLLGLKDFGSVNLPAGSKLTLSTPLIITSDTTLDLEISGDLFQTAQQNIVYGVKVTSSADVPGKMLEGMVSLPWTLENTGLVSANASITVRLLDGKNQIVTEHSRSVHLEKGKKFSGAVDAKLKPGQYRLELSGDGGVASYPFSINALAPLKLLVEDKGFSDGRQTFKARVENPRDGPAKAVLRRTFAGSIDEQGIDLKGKKSQVFEEVLLLGGLTIGKHPLLYEILENDKPKISWSGEVNVPKGEAKLVPPIGPVPLTVGTTAKLTFQIVNSTSTEVSQPFSFLVDGLVEEVRTILAVGYETVSHEFLFDIPDDFPQGTYKAEYEFGEVKGTVALSVEGPKVAVDWGLDKSVYAIGDTATLTMQVKNLGKPWSMVALVRYKGFEETQHFELENETQLTFEIPIQALDEEKIFLSINTDTGRSLYINRFDVTAAGDLVSVSLDKQDYDTGDVVEIHVIPQKTGNIRVSSIEGFLVEEIINASRTYTFALPEKMPQQTFFVDYTFEGISGRVPFNVRGDRVMFTSGQFTKNGDVCEATWKVISNRAMNTQMVVSIAGEDVSTEVVQIDKTIALQEGENILKESLSCKEIPTGLARVRTALYFEGSDQTSPAAVFDGGIDEGEAAVLSVKADRAVYEPGEPIKITVVSFGEDPTPMKLMSASGSVMWSGTITYNSVTQTTLEIGNLGPGEHSLTIQLGDSAPSTQQLRVVVQAPPTTQPVEPDPTPTPIPTPLPIPTTPSAGVPVTSPVISTAGVTTTSAKAGPTIKADRVRVLDEFVRRPRGEQVAIEEPLPQQVQTQATEEIVEEVPVEEVPLEKTVDDGSEVLTWEQSEPIVIEIPKPISPVRQTWKQELRVALEPTPVAKSGWKIPTDVLWRMVQMVLLAVVFGGGGLVYARARRARLRALKRSSDVYRSMLKAKKDKAAVVLQQDRDPTRKT